MPTHGREFYLNLDFDVSLRPGGGGERRALAARRARDLAPAFLLAAGREDRLLLEDPVPEEFLDSLRARGFEPASIGDVHAPDPDREFVPYGWNESTAAFAKRYTRVPDHPDLAVIRRVNSRVFSAELEHDLFENGHVLGTFESSAELERAMRSADAPHGFVAKANHSNASLGNRRLRSSPPTPEDRRFLDGLLEESGTVVLEAWQERVRDLVVTMQVERSGEASSLHVHEIVNTAEGAFLGALFGAGARPDETDDLREAGRRVAARLAEAGCFGPACFDAYTWTDGRRARLRPLVDLNVRLGMSQPFREVSRRLGDDRVCYGRFFSARRFPFGGDQQTFEGRLGDRAFDANERRGVLLASPLQLGEGEDARVARRFAVVFVGESREEVLAMNASFRDEFDR